MSKSFTTHTTALVAMRWLTVLAGATLHRYGHSIHIGDQAAGRDRHRSDRERTWKAGADLSGP